jgi:hypothetical protein
MYSGGNRTHVTKATPACGRITVMLAIFGGFSLKNHQKPKLERFSAHHNFQKAK